MTLRDEADRKAGLRRRVMGELLRQFGPATPFRLTFAISGQIGIDCAPCGWDKTFCLNFLPLEQFPTIHFFGDKTHEGGGDYELYAVFGAAGPAHANRVHNKLFEFALLPPPVALALPRHLF